MATLEEYRILRSTDEELRAIYQMEEGIENRLKGSYSRLRLLRSVSNSSKQTVELGKVATTSRLCFTGVTKGKWKTIGAVQLEQGTVLGFTSKGQEWLKNMRESESFHFNYQLRST